MVILGIILLAITVQVFSTALMAKVLGVPMAEIALGLGPHLTLRVGPPALKVGLIPGGYVQFVVDPDHPNQFVRLSPIRRLLITVGGPLLLFGIATGLAGVEQVIAAMLACGHDVLQLFHPLGVAQEGLAQAAALLQQDPRIFAGMLLSKILAYNLLPLSTLPVGTVIKDFFPSPHALWPLWTAISLLFQLWLFIAGGTALLFYVFGS